jgi:hypothetical protein
MLKLLAAATLAASLTAWAQSDMRPSQSTDKEKIADALRAGPEFITKDAVIADWPANPKDPNPQYRVLRAGKSDWTCLPGIPGYPHRGSKTALLTGLCACAAEEECGADLSAYAGEPRAQPGDCARSQRTCRTDRSPRDGSCQDQGSVAESRGTKR